MNKNYYKLLSLDDDQNCDVCGLLELKINGETDVFQTKTKPSRCWIKYRIAYLHQQILGCQKDDEDAKPVVSLSPNNEFFTSHKFKDLQMDHKCLLDVFYNEEDYEKSLETNLSPMKKVKFVCIEKLDELQIMLDDLKKHKEIAVNLEYHSRRSYFGFSWLLQISTEDTYYMINCIKLQKDLHILNAVFMELEVLKIFHNGEAAVLRLYKDFGIFVSNMFDTAILKKIIMESKEKELFQKNFVLQTTRIHTHALIFIKKYLINFLLKLHKKKFLKTMRQSCKKICEKVDHYKANWNKLNFKSVPTENTTNRERYVIMELLTWRNKVAQIEDESPNFILPDNDILKIARELFHKNTSTLYECYGAKFLNRMETHFNVDEVVFKAMRKSNKGKNLQLFMDTSNQQCIEPNSRNFEDTEKRSQKNKSQKTTKQDKINRLKRVPKF